LHLRPSSLSFARGSVSVDRQTLELGIGGRSMGTPHAERDRVWTQILGRIVTTVRSLCISTRKIAGDDFVHSEKNPSSLCILARSAQKRSQIADRVAGINGWKQMSGPTRMSCGVDEEERSSPPRP
jgi:hypothetical protein